MGALQEWLKALVAAGMKMVADFLNKLIDKLQPAPQVKKPEQKKKK